MLTIGIFSSSACGSYNYQTRYKKAINFLKHKKCEIIEGNLSGKHLWWLSGTAQDRANEFNELVLNKNIDCLLSTIGGWNSNSILNYINYEQFKTSDKKVVGLSDTTALLLALYNKTGKTVFYGQSLLTSYGEIEKFANQDWNYLINLLVERRINYTLTPPAVWTDEFLDWTKDYKDKTARANSWKYLGEKIINGRLIGGNLNTMIYIWGTEYMPEIKTGDILLIEDSCKSAADLYREFAFLDLHQVFNKVAGIIFSKIELYDDLNTNLKAIDILKMFIPQHMTVVYDVDCGHAHPSMLLPIGGEIQIDPINKQIKILNY